LTNISSPPQMRRGLRGGADEKYFGREITNNKNN
jgi:hypothetical protein